MPSNLRKLVDEIRISKSGTAADLLRSKGKPSILYAAEKAAEIDNETILDGAINGLEELEEIDSKFGSYRASLFNPSQLKKTRELCTREENEEIDRMIQSFLKLLSPYIMLPVSHPILEHLVRHYKLFHYNVDEFLRCLLPCHETTIFIRATQLITYSKEGEKWKFLENVGKSGLPLERIVLNRNVSRNYALFEFICDSVMRIDETSRGNFQNLHSFFTVLISEIIDSMKNITERILKTMLPMLVFGLKRPQLPALQSGCYIILIKLSSKTTLSSDLANVFINALSQPKYCSTNVDRSIQCITAIVQSQERVQEFPIKAFKNILKLPDFVDELCEASGKYNITKLFKLIVLRLIDAVDGSQDEPVTSEALNLFIKMVNSSLSPWPESIFPEFAQWTASKLISSFCNKPSGHALSDPRSTRFKAAMSTLVRKYPEHVDNALSVYLSSNDNKTPQKASLLVKESFKDSDLKILEPNLIKMKLINDRDHAGTEVSLSCIEALTHPSSSVREKTVQSLNEILPSNVSNLKSVDTVALTLSNLLLSLLEDDSNSVVAALKDAIPAFKFVLKLNPEKKEIILRRCVDSIDEKGSDLFSSTASKVTSDQVKVMESLLQVISEVSSKKSLEELPEENIDSSVISDATNIHVTSKLIDILGLSNEMEKFQEKNDIIALVTASMKCPIFVDTFFEGMVTNQFQYTGLNGQMKKKKRKNKIQIEPASLQTEVLDTLSSCVMKFVNRPYDIVHRFEMLQEIFQRCKYTGQRLLLDCLNNCAKQTFVKPSAEITAIEKLRPSMLKPDSVDVECLRLSSCISKFLMFVVHCFGEKFLDKEHMLKYFSDYNYLLPVHSMNITSLILDDHRKRLFPFCFEPLDVLLYLINVQPESMMNRKDALFKVLQQTYGMRVLPVLTAISCGFLHDDEMEHSAAMSLKTSATFIKSLSVASNPDAVSEAVKDAVAAFPLVLLLTSSDSAAVRAASFTWAQSLTTLLSDNTREITEIYSKTEFDISEYFSKLNSSLDVPHCCYMPAINVLRSFSSTICMASTVSNNERNPITFVLNEMGCNRTEDEYDAKQMLQYLWSYCCLLARSDPFLSSLLLRHLSEIQFELKWDYIQHLILYLNESTISVDSNLSQVLVPLFADFSKENERITDFVNVVVEIYKIRDDREQPSSIREVVLKSLNRLGCADAHMSEVHKTNILLCLLLTENKYGTDEELQQAKRLMRMKLTTLSKILRCICAERQPNKAKKETEYQRLVTNSINKIKYMESRSSAVSSVLSLVIDYVGIALSNSDYSSSTVSEVKTLLGSLCEALETLQHKIANSTEGLSADEIASLYDEDSAASEIAQMDQCATSALHAVSTLLSLRQNHVNNIVDGKNISQLLRLLKMPFSNQTLNAGALVLAQMVELNDGASIRSTHRELVDLIVCKAEGNTGDYRLSIMHQMVGKIFPIIQAKFSSCRITAQTICEEMVDSLREAPPENQRVLFESFVEALGNDLLPCLTCCLLSHSMLSREAAERLIDSLLTQTTPAVHLSVLSNLLLFAQTTAFEVVNEKKNVQAMFRTIAVNINQKKYPPVLLPIPVDESSKKTLPSTVDFFGMRVGKLTGRDVADAKQMLERTLHLISSQLRSDSMQLKVAIHCKSNGEESLRDKCLTLFQNATTFLTLLEHLQAEKSQAQSRQVWMSYSKMGNDITEGVESLISSNCFAKILLELINHENNHLKLKSIEALTAKCFEISSEVDSRVYLDLFSSLFSISCRLSDPRNVTNEQASVQESALMCIHSMTHSIAVSSLDWLTTHFNKLCDTFVHVSSTFLEISLEEAGEKNRAMVSLMSCMILCLASLVSVLKARAFYKLSSFLPPVLDVLDYASSATAFHMSRFLLQTLFTSLSIIIVNLRQFIHPYLSRMLKLSLRPNVLLAKDLNRCQERMHSTIVTCGISTHLLVSSVISSFSLESSASSVCKLQALVGSMCSHLKPRDVNEYSSVLFEYFVNVLEYRSHRCSSGGSTVRVSSAAPTRRSSTRSEVTDAEDVEGRVGGAPKSWKGSKRKQSSSDQTSDGSTNEVTSEISPEKTSLDSKTEFDQVEESTAAAVVCTLMKLNESAMRSFLHRISHWKNADGREEVSQLSSFDRLLSFYSLFPSIAEAFKGIAVPYLSNSFEEMGSILSFAANVEVKERSDKKRKKQLKDGGWDGGRPMSAEQGSSLHKLCCHLLLSLSRCFQYDNSNIVTSKQALSIVPGLIDQLQSWLTVSLRVNRIEYADDLVCPCIANLVQARREDSLWKAVVSSAVQKATSSDRIVRRCAIRALHMCFRSVGEEFLGMLPECLPVLSEALEDDDERVVDAATDMIKYIETTLGQDVEEYLG